MFMEEKMNVRFLWEAVMRTEGTLFWLLMHFWGPTTVPGNSSMLVAQLCPTLYDPMACRLSGTSVPGIFQARILEWVAIFSPEDLPNPGIESGSPTLQEDSTI